MQAGGPAGASPGGPPGRTPEAPAWARRLQQRQAAGQALSTAAHAVRAGDQPGGGTSVSLKEDGS